LSVLLVRARSPLPTQQTRDRRHLPLQHDQMSPRLWKHLVPNRKLLHCRQLQRLVVERQPLITAQKQNRLSLLKGQADPMPAALRRIPAAPQIPVALHRARRPLHPLRRRKCGQAKLRRRRPLRMAATTKWSVCFTQTIARQRVPALPVSFMA